MSEEEEAGGQGRKDGPDRDRLGSSSSRRRRSPGGPCALPSCNVSAASPAGTWGKPGPGPPAAVRGSRVCPAGRTGLGEGGERGWERGGGAGKEGREREGSCFWEVRTAAWLQERQLQLPRCLLGSSSWGEGAAALVCGRRRVPAPGSALVCSRTRSTLMTLFYYYFKGSPSLPLPFFRGVLTRRWAADPLWR